MSSVNFSPLRKIVRDFCYNKQNQFFVGLIAVLGTWIYRLCRELAAEKSRSNLGRNVGKSGSDKQELQKLTQQVIDLNEALGKSIQEVKKQKSFTQGLSNEVEEQKRIVQELSGEQKKTIKENKLLKENLEKQNQAKKTHKVEALWPAFQLQEHQMLERKRQTHQARLWKNRDPDSQRDSSQNLRSPYTPVTDHMFSSVDVVFGFCCSNCFLSVNFSYRCSLFRL